jgi:hypothetical protein
MTTLFQVHILNAGGLKKAEQIAGSFNFLLDILETVCPAGRELALVRTKLEEAAFFAKKSMANDPQNQK